jgi:hypothetical protein
MKLSLDPRKPREYILKAERTHAPEVQTVFLLRPFTVYDEAELAAFTEAQGATQSARLMIETVRRALVGWRNLEGPDGLLAFEKGEDGYATKQMVELLPTAIVLELFNAIVGRESVTRDEAGKS